jgi:hypothetical protein
MMEEETAVRQLQAHVHCWWPLELKANQGLRAVAEKVECLPSKCKDLILSLGVIKCKTKQR